MLGSEDNLGEQPPPLPVLQLEVTSTVPLDDLHGRQLLLTFTKRSVENKRHLSARRRPQDADSPKYPPLTCVPESLELVPGRR